MNAPKRDTDVGGPAFGREDPGAQLPWRVVTHVLRMPTLEVGNPVTVVILVEADNAPRRPAGVSEGELP